MKVDILQGTAEGMSKTSFHLSKFSPLRTPDVRKLRKNHNSDDDYVSSSSIESSMTNDLMHLSQTIQKKLSSDKTNRFSDSSPEKVSDGNLFITQVSVEQIRRVFDDN